MNNLFAHGSNPSPTSFSCDTAASEGQWMHLGERAARTWRVLVTQGTVARASMRGP
jgi:hypothetical protein